MKEPYWLTRSECLALHDMMLAHYGGCSGIRDEGLLESALARPRQLHHYGSPSLPEMAAAYAAGIVKNHPFLDGNKRTGLACALVFLALNGVRLHVDGRELYAITMAVATSTAGDAEVAAYFRSRLP
jgi:death-on-curing protein